MNFSDLMDVASSKQQLTEQKAKNRKAKGGSDAGVSSEAVKAFLARQNAEKLKQKAEEEAARRARIKARLEQEQKDKSKNKKQKGKDTGQRDSSNQQRRPPESAPQSSINVKSHIDMNMKGKSRVAHERKFTESKPLRVENQLESVQVEGNSRKRPRVKNVESKQKMKSQREDKLENGVREGPKLKAVERSSDKGPETATNSKKPGTKKRKSASSAPLLSFQELMNVAKQQMENPDAAKQLLLQKRKIAKPDMKEKASPEDVEGTHEQPPIKNKVLPKAAAVPLKNAKCVQRKRNLNANPSKTPQKLNKSETESRVLPKRPLDAVHRSLQQRPKQMTIERTTISEKRQEDVSVRRPVLSHTQKRRYYEEDEDEMSDFIDDAEESGPDVSSYIKDIFGYDRNRYRDREDDTDNMESSFADIQREEAKSARIAKLEDEIEKLKESYEEQRRPRKKRLKR